MKTPDLPPMPKYIRINPTDIRFCELLGKWYITGPLHCISEGTVVSVSRHKDTPVEVYVTKLKMARKVYHKTVQKFITYVVAEFEDIIDDSEF